MKCGIEQHDTEEDGIENHSIEEDGIVRSVASKSRSHTAYHRRTGHTRRVIEYAIEQIAVTLASKSRYYGIEKRFSKSIASNSRSYASLHHWAG